MGSVMANGISSMLFGGRSNEAAPVEQQQGGSYQQQAAATSCEIQAKGTYSPPSFEVREGRLTNCGWFRLYSMSTSYLFRHVRLRILPRSTQGLSTSCRSLLVISILSNIPWNSIPIYYINVPPPLTNLQIVIIHPIHRFLPSLSIDSANQTRYLRIIFLRFELPFQSTQLPLPRYLIPHHSNGKPRFISEFLQFRPKEIGVGKMEIR